MQLPRTSPDTRNSIDKSILQFTLQRMKIESMKSQRWSIF